MDKKQNRNDQEIAEEQNLNHYRELEIDLNRSQSREELAEDLNFNRNQITHNREG